MPIFLRKQKEIPPIEVSEKHVLLRTICFFLALVVAVGAITFGVTRIGYKEQGVYALTAAADQELLLYGNGLHANFLFRGGSNEIKAAIASADKVYTQVLKKNYKLLDAEREYVGVVNVASFNARPNQDLQVSPELFAVLTDAWARTQEQRGFSIFAGPLYAEWNSILFLTEPEDFDPLRDPDEAERLEMLAARCGDPEEIRLVVVDEENCILRLEVSKDYLHFVKDMEAAPLLLDLNLLREAYLLELVGRELEEQGLTEGYLNTDSGLNLALSGQKSGIYCLYGLRDAEPLLTVGARVSPGSACCLFTAFPLLGGETAFYSLEEEGQVHLRNPYLPADGVDRELLLSSCVLRSDGDLVQTCYESICLRSARSAEDLERMAGESDSAVAWMLQGDESAQVFTNPAAQGLFSPAG